MLGEAKFKVGDKVKIFKSKKDNYWYRDKIGQEYVISQVKDHFEEYTFYMVEGEPTGIMEEDLVMSDVFMKIDLKTGMRVEHRNGQIFIVVKELDKLFKEGGFNRLSEFNDDLTLTYCEEWDIMKVYERPANNYFLREKCLGDLIWERVEMTEEQRQIEELQETIKKAQEQIDRLQETIKSK